MLAECRDQDDALAEESGPVNGRRLKIGYGPSGEVVSVENDAALLLYEWNPLMRIVAARKDGFELKYAYNLRGDNTALPRARAVESNMSGTAVLASSGWSTALRESTRLYEVRDLIAEILMPNGCAQMFRDDSRHRMISLVVSCAPTGLLICAREFTYDAAGRMIRYVDSLKGHTNLILTKQWIS